MRPGLDGGVCLVADPSATLDRALVPIVVAAAAAGVSMVQLRWKDGPTRDLVTLGRVLVAALAPFNVPLVINDRVDVALACGAHGVHVGQQDMAVTDVRRLLGEAAIVGLSVTCEDDALRLDPALVDYAGVGPIFATPTKPDAAPPLGLDGLIRVRSLLRVPSIAIGGIDATNAESVIAAGADGIAVVSAICAAEEPERAARVLVSHIHAARAMTR